MSDKNLREIRQRFIETTLFVQMKTAAACAHPWASKWIENCFFLRGCAPKNVWHEHYSMVAHKFEARWAEVPHAPVSTHYFRNDKELPVSGQHTGARIKDARVRVVGNNTRKMFVENTVVVEELVESLLDGTLVTATTFHVTSFTALCF